MINTNIIVNIKTNEEANTVDFTYKREDLEPIEDTNQKLLVMYVEQLIRAMIDSGMVAPTIKGKEDVKNMEE